MTDIDANFDDFTTVRGLTVNNLAEISYEDMLSILTPLVLTQVPEGSESIDEQRRIDFLLARTANLFAFLRTLWAYASYQRANLKREDKEAAEMMQKKKETLYELGNAMKLKYEACSRKLTLMLEGEGSPRVTDRVNYDRGANAAPPPSNSGWGERKASAPPPRAQGGWGDVR